MNDRIWICLITIFLVSSCLKAQDTNVLAGMSPSNIPSAPAFNLLGVNPELITRPSDVKEFKVDWRIKNYKVAPDLALEMQPLWWFYYRNKGISHYRNISPLEKTLSSLSFSLATAKLDNMNHLAYAFKVNLYKEKDPFIDNESLADIEKEMEDSLLKYEKQIDSISHLLDLERDDPNAISILKNKMTALRYECKLVNQNSMRQLKEASEAFIEENWNMDMIDLAFGMVYKYDNNSLDSIKMKNAGYGIWLNGAKGIGKHHLITSLIKMNHVGQNNNLSIGLSYRYGSNRFNFFLEAVYARMNNHIENGFSENEIFAEAYTADLGSGWFEYQNGDSFSSYTLSYGGDFRLGQKILLNFALRTELSSNMKITRFLPIANLVCLMN